MSIPEAQRRIESYDGRIVVEVYGFEKLSSFMIISLLKSEFPEETFKVEGSREEMRDFAEFLKTHMEKIDTRQRHMVPSALDEFMRPENFNP